MIRFAMRSLARRPRRALLSAGAVLLGVALVAGTLVFTDTIDAAYRQLFRTASGSADVVVTSRADLTSRFSSPPPISVRLLRRIRQLPVVADAYGQVVDRATFVDRAGRAIEPAGSTTLALSFMPPPFDSLRFAAGRRPIGSDQVTIDAATARSQGLRVGNQIRIVTDEPAKRFLISGIATLSRSGSGGVHFAVFALGTARSLFGKEGGVDAIYIRILPGATAPGLLAELAPILGPQLVARTTAGNVDVDVQRAGQNLSLLRAGLAAFAVIAGLIGALLVLTITSLTVSRRAAEFALLRALGASRRQTAGAVALEALATGLPGAVLGLGAGIGAAAGIRALLVAAGFDLPSTPLAIEPRTAIVSVAGGLLVALLAALPAALRATGATPLEALGQARAGRPRRRGEAVPLLIAAAFAVTGAALIAASSGASASRAITSGAGGVLVLFALATLLPRGVPAAARALALPLGRGDLVTGRLARENATRTPSRTALSAAPLAVGLALVLFVTVYVNAVHVAAQRAIDRTLVGDFTIESRDGSSPIPAAAVRAAVLTPGLASLASLKTSAARVGHDATSANGIDPSTLPLVYRFDWIGPAPDLNALEPGDALVEQDTAAREHLRAGERTTLASEAGTPVTVTVRGIYRDRATLTGVTVTDATFNSLFDQPRLRAVFVKLAAGTDPSVAGDYLAGALRSLPGVVARSSAELGHQVGRRVDRLVLLLYALLAVSAVISVLGLAGALSLGIQERTRELGIMRAVGMTPAQVRRLVRAESMIAALFGTGAGLVLGVGLAWVMTRALAGQGLAFAVPWLQVGILAALGVAAGVVAALPPAARASRLDVLASLIDE